MAYPIPWLDCRFPFDEKARNTSLIRMLVYKLIDYDNPHILDLGAGNGSNYKFWKDKLTTGTHWTFLETDADLCEELAKLGVHNTVVNGTVQNLEKLVDLSTVDLVMANALFDLFPKSDFRATSKIMKLYDLPFYFTLNYTGMNFNPGHHDDELVIGLYHQHMQREQHFGRAMGHEGPKDMASTLGEMNIPFRTGESIWNVEPDDNLMLSYLLGFMDEAIHELELTTGELNKLENWLQLRRAQIVEGQLKIVVFHEDIVGGSLVHWLKIHRKGAKGAR